MAVENNWRTPATKYDEDYKIDVTTLAPMAELAKGNGLKETGKETKGNEYRDIIRSDELEAGVSIAVEDGGLDKSEAGR